LAAKCVLALNCGSSSLKFGLYRGDGTATERVCEGTAEEIGRENASFRFKSSNGKEEHEERTPLRDHASALQRALEALGRSGAAQPDIVGHRFVHGGPNVRKHQRATPAVIEQLRAAVSFAPLHLPAALAVLDSMGRTMPHVPQIVCLDTAFHSTMPDIARTFALPDEVRKLGVERYGFHGLSMESIVAQLRPLPGRVVVAHLGNGASITAIRDGKSMDNTMGLTPTGGVMMGTRCGDLDPGIVIYLMRHGYGKAEALEDLFYHRSGLLGISNKTSDVRQLLAARRDDAQAGLALRMFCYQVRKAIAGMASALKGLDALVFTGGIGEHATELRDDICSGLEFLGNFQTLVLPAQEDLQIARITERLLEQQG
jgi:acetate kinase